MRYFFNLQDGIAEVDLIGSEFPDLETARWQAIRFAGEVLQSEPWHLADGPLQVLVHNQDCSETFRIAVEMKP